MKTLDEMPSQLNLGYLLSHTHLSIYYNLLLSVLDAGPRSLSSFNAGFPYPIIGEDPFIKPFNCAVLKNKRDLSTRIWNAVTPSYIDWSNVDFNNDDQSQICMP